MKKYMLGLLLALAACLPSFSGTGVNRVFKDQAGNTATLLVEPCTLEFLPPEVRQNAFAARLNIEGKLLKACYIERNGFVMLVDEDEDMLGPFDSSIFRPVKEA